MTLYDNQNYAQEEISSILARIRSCVEKNRYTISLNENRQKNIDFINEYNICSDKQKSILIKIKTDDFRQCVQNTNPGFEYEILYVFVSRVQLVNAEGIEETVDVYIKLYVVDLPTSSWTVVISFHKKDR